MIFWELIGNPSQNQWDFLNIDGDTPLAGMYGIPTCRNILRITLHEEISPISGESRPRPLLVFGMKRKLVKNMGSSYFCSHLHPNLVNVCFHPY